ncbi:Cys-tRNA(Pro) deacylase [Leucobacter sp. UCMA 4100]|uniref:Cys-tRNA(Pro) deacylase n=1 Tax=Leucobacter sp. UCMA 4100 TaxID=2810534 RepID=UPI0022EA1697|nr:Cys-tRNA(Pro) deacylase [Leucobacter sp. UCMA 4100]MDA3145829.1 Cys-tRNA(Pro) deacylase [Leucobacter sp. UCMA 4100]
MAKKKAKAVTTPATQALDALGVSYSLHEYTHDPRNTDFGRECAEQLGVDEARVFKTLVVQADGEFAVVVIPVSNKAVFKKVAAALGAKKADLAASADAERRSGYVLGGVSPFGHRQPMRIVVDESANDWPTVFVSGGRRGLDLEIAPDALLKAAGAVSASLTS